MWANHLIGVLRPWRSDTASTSACIAHDRGHVMIFDVSATLSRSILQNLATLEAMRLAAGAPSSAYCSITSKDARLRPSPIHYYGGAAGFDATWADVTIGAEALARRIAEKR